MHMIQSTFDLVGIHRVGSIGLILIPALRIQGAAATLTVTGAPSISFTATPAGITLP